MRLWPWACALVCCACASLHTTLAATTAAKAAAEQAQPAICVVVRTFWGHGGDNALQRRQGLRRLLTSLQQQSNPNWEAVLVVLDSEPFRDLHRILQDLDDDRIWVFAEWIAKAYMPKQQGVWTAGYHEKLYNLTDDAIHVCPTNTEWVVVTNGDNDYASTFFSRIARVQGADLIAFDFYSRYHRATGMPCERFGQQEGAPTCKPNRLRWCHTDLGANVMRWPRLMAENRRFGFLAALSQGLSAEHYDGVMAQTLAGEWPVAHVRDCLYDHSPTPQRCAREGGVWDDSDMAPSGVGGKCLNSWQASKRLKDGRGSLEEVVVSLAHDAHLAGFEDAGEAGVTAMRCLRRADATRQQHELMAYFGETCAEDVDLPAFNDPAFKLVAKEIRQKVEDQAAAAAAAKEAAVPKAPGPPKDKDTSTTATFREKFGSDAAIIGTKLT